nr:PREDICTED: coiled-coil domain-containing protein 167 isoform X1 [Anolis carolinensis]|eukprot:XP_008123350.1 PREDICTED: coiled-coil domain-containing protein 167 isoform X1 [Anolis carolinensis]
MRGREAEKRARMSPFVQRGGRKMSEKQQQDGGSVARQVENLEDKLMQCREDLEEVDFKLRREEMTPERRESLEKEKSLLTSKAEAYDGFRAPFPRAEEMELQGVPPERPLHHVGSPSPQRAWQQSPEPMG